MRVLMVHSFHHPRGGDTTYTRDLSRLLEGAGHQVIPLAMRHPDNEPSIFEARFPSWVDMRGAHSPLDRLRAMLGMVWSPEASRAARALARELRPDVAHVQHLHRHLTPSILAALRREGVPVVWTVHDYELVCPSGLLFTQGRPCERCRGHRYHQAVLHRCKWESVLPSVAVAVEKQAHHVAGVWEMVDRFLCPSLHLARTLVRFGVPAHRVEHLPNPLDVSDAPAADGPGAGWFYAGRLAEEKGVQVAIDAARRLPGHPLTICGGGPMEEALRAQAAPMPWVRFLGHQPRAEVTRLLAGVRVAVVPSLWPENFPYAVLEAQRAGRAVVASDIGGITEQIQHGVDGLRVPPGDSVALARAVEGLLADADRATALGQAGRRRVERDLAPRAHLDAVLRIYAQVRSAADRGRSPT
ncbi:glycosyltransferase family 4 protein [Myxococcota bacterium]|nr:glycosyltransferase family 4 protein [Myxococcota bacterium]